MGGHELAESEGESRMSILKDVSPDFKYNAYDREVGEGILLREATPGAIVYFANVCHRLSDYAYWFFLSTLWVSYSGQSDLRLWRRLFKSPRSRRKTSLMKPSEVEAYDGLDEEFTVYRAHRKGEADWISYTLCREIAIRFARERDVNEIAEYRLKKKDVIALFLRRSEQEVIMLRPRKAEEIGVISLLAD